ncbi:hypothetical protein L484_009376 [Morus notabilis]|uniref:Transmembrane protein 194A n=1 Tax=Morus notabilis TaxID=981085 RepID=W9RUN4_9ROSA|nr:uncharacterized protein LOC21392710 [Morus notabilis]XP_024032779.1 uncharacterized protein LOC112095310 [Morus notabilis]EXB94032.1 hypothetical protein L484_009376 [Morus notabilis]
MGSAKPFLLSACIFSLFAFLPSSSSLESAGERSLVVAPSAVMQLSHGLPVKNSPGKHGKSMFCERIHIYGLSRIKNLGKFAHSATVKIAGRNSSVHVPNAEVCFHRNLSLAIGMCPEVQWEKVTKGSWVRHMSPFDRKILDIQTATSSLESFEVSIEEEFFLHRVVLLVLGIVMLSLASFLSKSLVFYYGSAMAIGVILVILVVLFQGMKLIPFGGRRLAIFIPSSIAGLGYILKQVAPDFLRAILTMLGIDQEMYDPVVKFLLAFVILAGAWLGFWVVRKVVLTEDGSIDISTSLFVAWSIRTLGALMILQSSADPVLATEALILGIIVSSLLRRIFRLRFLRRVYKKLMKSAKKDRRISHLPDSSASEDSLDEETNTIRSNVDSSFLRRPLRNFTVASSRPDQGFGRRILPQQQLDTGLHLSSFHATPERRKFSKQDWEKFTRDSTEKALDELVSSPGFGKWLYRNADRISVSPNSGRAERQRKWLLWS